MAERRWSEPFITMLEALRMPTQFQAGRRLLRTGQVRGLTISSSLATASVRDSDGETYRTRIAARAFTGADWRRIERALAQQAIHAARLLSGRVPDDLPEVLRELGLSLFPQELHEVAMDCACAGRPVPCRHLTATCYALSESFDHDPFSILAWRGRGRDELLERLRELRTAAAPPAPVPEPPGTGFWTAGPRLASRLAPQSDDNDANRPDALLDQFEPLDLTVGPYQVADLLRAAYRAMGVFVGTPNY